MQRITVAERRARLGRRHGLAPSARTATPTEAAARVLALHGTDAATVYLSALARTSGAARTDVEHALYEERSLLRVLAMRRTMWVAPVDTAAVLIAGAARDVAVKQRRQLLRELEEVGVAKNVGLWLRRAEAAAVAAFAAHDDLSATELAQTDKRLARQIVLGRGNLEVKQSVASRLLLVLSAEGRVVRTRPSGGWTSTQFRWAAMDTWHPDLSHHEDDAARALLAERWLRAFGPATLDDLKWWTGWGVRDTKAALAAIATEEVDLDGEAGLVLEGDTEPEAVEPWVALLPALDPTIMGHKRRDFYLSGHGPLLFDANGNAGPTVWCDGRVVGGWAQAPDFEIRVELLEDVGAEARAMIDRASAELHERVDATKLSPRARGRSEIEQRLLGLDRS